MAPLFIVEEGWKWKGKIQKQDHSNSAPNQVTRDVWLDFFLWHLLKLHLHLLFMSHGRCDLSLYIYTSYIYIYTSLYVLLKRLLKSNYKKRHPMMLVPTSSPLDSIARVNHRIWGIVRFGGRCSVTTLSWKAASVGWGRREDINCHWPRLLSDVGLYWRTGTSPPVEV